jgi:hypothetical protein
VAGIERLFRFPADGKKSRALIFVRRRRPTPPDKKSKLPEFCFSFRMFLRFISAGIRRESSNAVRQCSAAVEGDGHGTHTSSVCNRRCCRGGRRTNRCRSWFTDLRASDRLAAADASASTDWSTCVADIGNLLNPDTALGEIATAFDPNAVADLTSLLSGNLAPNASGWVVDVFSLF